MGRRSQHSIRKRQRELKKREKADAKRLKKAERKGGEEFPEDGPEGAVAAEGDEVVEGAVLPESAAVEPTAVAADVEAPAAQRVAD
jgi:hypothetical protein